MTISNRGTNNSNSAYVSNEFEKQETAFRIKKEKAARKEKKGHNTNSLQAFEPSNTSELMQLSKQPALRMGVFSAAQLQRLSINRLIASSSTSWLNNHPREDGGGKSTL